MFFHLTPNLQNIILNKTKPHESDISQLNYIRLTRLNKRIELTDVSYEVESSVSKVYP